MSQKLPREFETVAHMPGVKTYWLGSSAPKSPWDCSQCGGVGILTLFVALEGPFNSVPSPTQGLSAKWDGNIAKWWNGKHLAIECPNCKGSGHDPHYHASSAKQRELDVTGVLKQTKRVDYTGV